MRTNSNLTTTNRKHLKKMYELTQPKPKGPGTTIATVLLLSTWTALSLWALVYYSLYAKEGINNKNSDSTWAEIQSMVGWIGNAMLDAIWCTELTEATLLAIRYIDDPLNYDVKNPYSILKIISYFANTAIIAMGIFKIL